MTVLCGGGTSVARPGFGAAVSVGVAQLAALLNNVPTPLAFALSGYLGLIAYDLSTFCTTDPPPMPTITAADWTAALLLVDPVAHFQAIQKFTDLIANLVWPTFCECATGATPAPPALPVPPTNLPTVDPTALPTGPAASPCWHVTQSFRVGPTTTNLDISNVVFPSGSPQSVSSAFTGAPTQAPAFPFGINHSKIQVSLDSPISGTLTDVIIQFNPFNAAGTPLASFGIDFFSAGPNPAPFVDAFPVASTACLATVNAGQVHTLTVDVTLFCAGAQPTSVTTPCCPPDPSVSAMLQEMLSLIRSLYLGAPAPLRSFAESTVHATLSGSGHFTVGVATLGVKVESTVPTSYGRNVGDPTEFFDVGWITTSAAEGAYKSIRIEHSTELVLFDPLVDTVHYTLSPGVVATITELTRGP